MAIGGAEDKVHGREILYAFFTRSGGSNGKIAIFPCASREPAVIGDKYRGIFESMGAASVKVLDIRYRDRADDSEFRDYVETCTGAFMTGGDQLRLCGMLSDTALMDRVRSRAQTGEMTLAGTSAGAAIMGHHMIAGGGSGESPNCSLVDMAMGLDILPFAIVDQHFHNRNRMARLLSAVSMHPDRLGIGIDEDTSAVFKRDRTVEVLGKGTVTFVDPTQISFNGHPQASASDPVSLHNLRLHVLRHGESYSLDRHEPCTPAPLPAP